MVLTVDRIQSTIDFLSVMRRVSIGSSDRAEKGFARPGSSQSNSRKIRPKLAELGFGGKQPRGAELGFRDKNLLRPTS